MGLIDARDNRFSVSDISDATVCRRRAENNVEAQVAAGTTPGPKGEGKGESFIVERQREKEKVKERRQPWLHEEKGRREGEKES